MTANLWPYFIYVTVFLYLLRKLQVRLRLSKAKYPSLAGHSKMSRLVAKLVPFYEYSDTKFFISDGAPIAIAQRRQTGFERLKQKFNTTSPQSIAMTEALESSISDVLFTNAYRVPFQYRNYVRNQLKLGVIATASAGTMIKDLDDNWSYDLSGSYGVIFTKNVWNKAMNASRNWDLY